MTEEIADPLKLVGTTIADKYAIESVVGAGGFAVVYRAMHLLWKVPVAVKVFNALGAVSKDQRQRLLEDFLQEGRLLTQLSGKTTAILQARDVAMLTTPDGESVPYMVLEWLEGKSLDVILEDERKRGVAPRTMEQTVKLLQPIADALAIAHEQGIVHRDMKPANIFVLGDPRSATSTGGVKLLDFGIAKVVQDAQKMGFAKTAGHITSFTPYYGAPEQFDRNFGATCPATDVFAFALVVAETISGREPMVGDSIVQLAYIACDPNKRPTPRALGVMVPDDTEAVFAKALAVRIEDRFATAGEFWAALKATTGITSDNRISAPSAVPNPSHPSAPAAAFAATAVAAPTTPVVAPVVPPLAATPAAKSKSAVLYAVLGLVGLAVVGGGAAFALKGKKDGKDPTPIPSASVVASASAAPSASASAAPTAIAKCPAGMAYVEGGDFFMGYDLKDAEDDEKPVHQVMLSPYCLDVYEVTASKYRECSDKGKCKRSTDNVWKGITEPQHQIYDALCTLRDDAKDKGDYPVNCIDWEQAQAYCAFRGGQLPTEAQWEYAARTADGRIYPWGDAKPTPDHLNACGAECLEWQKEHKADSSPQSMYDKGARDPYPTLAPVGKFEGGKTRFGIYDMVGNVGEWVSDWYGPYDAKTKTGMSKDPTGAAKGTKRVVRGGSWNAYDPTWLRPSYRFAEVPMHRTHGIGFRCAAKPHD